MYKCIKCIKLIKIMHITTTLAPNQSPHACFCSPMSPYETAVHWPQVVAASATADDFNEARLEHGFTLATLDPGAPFY